MKDKRKINGEEINCWVEIRQPKKKKKKEKIQDREGKGNSNKKSSKDTDEEVGKYEERDNKGRKIM